MGNLRNPVGNGCTAIHLLTGLCLLAALAACGDDGGRSEPACPDRDGDGFFSNADCGTIADCDDRDASVNFEGQEGPYGDPSCSDGRDNDCDGLADSEDPPCLQGDFNVIVVGWDGVQRDRFYDWLNRQAPECPEGLPHIAELSGGVFWNNTTTNGFTATKPGWAQILSGYDAEVTGIVSNKIHGPCRKVSRFSRRWRLSTALKTSGRFFSRASSETRAALAPGRTTKRPNLTAGPNRISTFLRTAFSWNRLWAKRPWP